MKSLALAWSLLAALALATEAQTAPRTADYALMRGSIEAAEGARVVLRTREGDTLDVRLMEDTRVFAVSGTTISDIRAGSYVGAAAVPDDTGALRALEVHVYDESLRGFAEGHRPYDLAENSTMTNATVGPDVAPSARAAQGEADDHARRILSLHYPGGAQRIVVPDEAPIVRLKPADRGLIGPGAKAIVFGEKGADGAITARILAVGTNGLTPPM
ncbi:MAG: hypothetical protein ACK4NA_13710 [Alphaproteobacteria bacterium]